MILQAFEFAIWSNFRIVEQICKMHLWVFFLTDDASIETLEKAIGLFEICTMLLSRTGSTNDWFVH